MDEETAVSQTKSVTLRHRPIRHDWCVARPETNPVEGTYFFCAWLTTPSCSYLQCADPRSECARCSTGEGECLRGTTGADTGAAAEPGAPPKARLAGGSTEAPIPRPRRTTAHPPTRVAADAGDEFRLPLGDAFDLRQVSRRLEASLGSGSFQLDYELIPSSLEPVIAGKGLQQTYMLFGGPGAGKTYFFRHLMTALLGHKNPKMGCLLLDPKGVLTDWLRRALEYHGRADDLTVLSAGSDEHAFNVLGTTRPIGSPPDTPGLAPQELGRLISEVVLAGTPVQEGWAPLLGDLLESSATVLSAHSPDGQLTADSWLRQILYTETNKVPYRTEPRWRDEAPILLAARRLKDHPDETVQLARQRVKQFYATTQPEQRRYLRQMIERSLGELMSPAWRYLSRGDNPAVYTGIIRDAKVVSVAVGQGSPAFQTSLSTLTKAIFQQAVLAELAQRPTDRRFFILACDEYAQAITEGESGMVSDSRFFSLSREAGCLSLLALQSVATGRSRFSASMRDRWEGILGNVTVEFFMRLNDLETAELGSSLAGTQHSAVPVRSTVMSSGGSSVNESVSILEHRRVPSWYLTNKLPQGVALVHGTLDGVSAPTSCFIRAPYPPLVP